MSLQARHATIRSEMAAAGMRPEHAAIGAYYALAGQRVAETGSTWAQVEVELQSAGLRCGRTTLWPRWTSGLPDGFA